MKKTALITILMIIIMLIFSNCVFGASGVVTATTVRLREKPDSSSNTLSLIGEGKKVEILGEEDGWYKVKYDGVTGYVSKDYIKKDGEASEETANEEPEEEEAEPQEPADVVEENEPENPVEEIPSGSEEANSEATNEAANEVPESERDYETTVIGDLENIKNTEITLTSDLEIRTVPSFSSKTLNTIGEGSTVTVIEILNKWVKITDGNVTGWAIVQKLDGNSGNESSNNLENPSSAGTDEPDTQEPSDKEPEPNNSEEPEENTGTTVGNTSSTRGTVNTDGARLRKSKDGTIYTVLDMNTEVEIVGEDGDWYIVNADEFTNAYISKKLIDK